MTQRRLSLRLLVAAAVVSVVCVNVLVADYLVASRRAAVEAPGIEALEAATKTDPAAAARLHEARERRTAAQRAREARGHVIAWLLLLSGAGVMAAGRWHRSSRPDPPPALEHLLAERFPQPAPLAARSQAAEDRPHVPDARHLDSLIERFGRHREAAIPILQAIQHRFGYLPDETLASLCERTEITPAQIAGTSSFYALFRRSPVGRHLVRVCHGTACHVAGAGPITAELRRHLGIDEGEDTDPERRFTIDRVACIGCCSLAPVMTVDDETLGRLDPTTARRALDGVEASS